MFVRNATVTLAIAALTACGSSSGTTSGGSPVTTGAGIRHTSSVSGNGGGEFKLVAYGKTLSQGGCSAGTNQWTHPGGTTLITIGHSAFYSASTLSLPSASAVTFTHVGDVDLVVSSSNSTYTPVGSFDGVTFTPPSAGTYYAGYYQEWYAADGCGAETVYDETDSFTWTQ